MTKYTILYAELNPKSVQQKSKQILKENKLTENIRLALIDTRLTLDKGAVQMFVPSRQTQ